MLEVGCALFAPGMTNAANLLDALFAYWISFHTPPSSVTISSVRIVLSRDDPMPREDVRVSLFSRLEKTLFHDGV
jgi:hypothetical protein